MILKEVSFEYKGKEYKNIPADTYGDLVTALKKDPQTIFYVKTDGVFHDLASFIKENNFKLEVYDAKGLERNQCLWHTSAHVLAQAIRRLYPCAREAIGPVTETGFFEDIDFLGKTLTPEELEAISKEMQKIIDSNYIIEKKELSKKEALEFFKDNPYKIANINKLPEGVVISTYKQGEYEDLCKGPHLYSTGQIGPFLLTNISSAYFMGNKDLQSLQRISGISFTDNKEYKQHMLFLEEAKKRDHRKIGKEMDLFSFHPEGPGFVFWHEKGTIIFNILTEYIRAQNEIRGYIEIKTPQSLNDELWKQSGHYDNFKDNMYFTQIDERSFALKPMNCPGACIVYKTNLHSYRDLPLKQAEFGLVHRHELSGVLHGLFRVRAFTQDDAHIFCTEEQLHEQVSETIHYILKVYETCGFKKVNLFIATRPEKSIGSDEEWAFSTKALMESIQKVGKEYQIKEGDGAFYGPKIEFNITDSLGRNWQCGTIQIDFSMPKRFELSYEGSDGHTHYPILIHRAILGSLERFIGILIEHYEGKFPLWLAPTQIRLVNVNEVQVDYMKELKEFLVFQGVRVEADFRNESLGYKVRNARNLRVPLIGVIGDEELANKTVTARDREGKNQTYSWQELVHYIKAQEQHYVGS
jgi:threonyl-tRNA synthetase